MCDRFLHREQTRIAALEAFERGDEERGVELMLDVKRQAESAMEKRKRELGES